MMPSSARERSPILNRARGLFAAIVVGALLGHASPAAAVKTSFWRTDDMAGFLQGEHVEGVALESDGYLTLGPSWDSVVTRLEGVSYIWSIARDSKGRIYFGTGDNGRIYRWTRGKGATLVWETGAGEITSLAVDRADNVYAGSAPGGIRAGTSRRARSRSGRSSPARTAPSTRARDPRARSIASRPRRRGRCSPRPRT
jgi:two component regulator with propeller domain